MLNRPSVLARLLAAVTGALLALAVAAPVQAFLRDVQVLQPNVVSHNGRPLLLTCPPPQGLIGMGAEVRVVAATGGIGLDKAWITAGRSDQAELGAINTDGSRGVWGISGQIVCASYTDTPPTSTTGGAYVKDVVVTRGESDRSSTTRRVVSADCGGRKAIGGGYSLLAIRPGSRTQTAPPSHVVADVAKIVPPNRFTVAAHETQAIPTTWWVESYAICANYTDFITGLIYLGPGPLVYTSTTPAGSVDRNTAVSCPQGWFLIAGGARITGAAVTQAPPGQVVLRSSQPTIVFASGRANAWLASAAEERATSASWRLQTTAMCAPLVFPS
jgi:hypothetical protein